jgi:hypothetical protein
MNKPLSVLMSMSLIFAGTLTLILSIVGPGFGFRVWQLWPLFVIMAGLAFVLPPLLVRDKPGLGALFIPGVPVLTTGAILFFASVFRMWDAWSWLWPMEVMAVALGFLIAALYMRNVWLLIPAIFVGANGLLMQFCALTGWWRVWAVLWTVEPLSVGLALLAVNLKRRSPGLLAAGVVMCLLAGVGLVESLGIALLSALLPVGWMWRWVGPVTLVLVGFGVLLWGLTRHAPVPRLATE